MFFKIDILLIMFFLFIPLINAQCLLPSEENVPVLAQKLGDLCSQLQLDDCGLLLNDLSGEWKLFEEGIMNEWRMWNRYCVVCSPFEKVYRELVNYVNIDAKPCCTYVPFEYIAEIDEKKYFVDFDSSENIGYLYDDIGKGLCKIVQNKDYDKEFLFLCLDEY